MGTWMVMETCRTFGVQRGDGEMAAEVSSKVGTHSRHLGVGATWEGRERLGSRAAGHFVEILLLSGGGWLF